MDYGKSLSDRSTHLHTSCGDSNAVVFFTITTDDDSHYQSYGFYSLRVSSGLSFA